MDREALVKQIYDILKDVNADIITYEGEDLIEDGIIDSFELVAIVTGIEDLFNVVVDAKYVEDGAFLNKESILRFVEELVMDK